MGPAMTIQLPAISHTGDFIFIPALFGQKHTESHKPQVSVGDTYILNCEGIVHHEARLNSSGHHVFCQNGQTLATGPGAYIVAGKNNTGKPEKSANLQPKTLKVPGERKSILNGVGIPPQLFSPNFIPLQI